MRAPITPIPVERRAADGTTTTTTDVVVTEAPLALMLDGEPLAVLMRTPGHDVELVLGLLRAEGVVRELSDVAAVLQSYAEDHADGVLDVRLVEPSPRATRQRAERTWLSSTSCGVCGKRTLEDLHHRAPPFPAAPRLDPELIASLPARLRAHQPVFDQTGGLHGVAVFDDAGEPHVVREDVGRHNAVDKCVGHFMVEERAWPRTPILVVSGRVSFEIVEKALVARIPAIVAVSAPSSLAIEVAARSRMSLYGFVRGGALTQYTGADGEARSTSAPVA